MEAWLSTKTWKSWVKEFGDKHNVVPTFEINEEYPGRQPSTFRSCVTINLENQILTAEATARSKKEAEHEAARVLIMVKMSPEMRETLNPSSKGNVVVVALEADPVSTIKMLCDQRKIGQPIYTDKEITGPSHNRNFTVACQIAELDITCDGAGKTKKDAKKAAAQAAVVMLKQKGYLGGTDKESASQNLINVGSSAHETMENDISTLLFPAKRETPESKSAGDTSGDFISFKSDSVDELLGGVSGISIRPKQEVLTDNESETESNESRKPEASTYKSPYLTEFETVESLGEGGFGTVYKAKKRFDGRTYAVKRISIPREEKAKQKIMREVTALAHLDHPNIVRYFNAWIEEPPEDSQEKYEAEFRKFANQPTSSGIYYGNTSTSSEEHPGAMYLYIHQELCQVKNMNTLKELIMSAEQREFPAMLSHFLDIATAIEYIHSEGIVHRDLKPTNIFITEKANRLGDNILVKIGDFGLAKYLQGHGFENSVSKDYSTTGKGTFMYMSPEQRGVQYYHKSVDKKTDIYPMGIILFEMLVPCKTGMERAKMVEALHENKFPENFITNHPEECAFIKQMMASNPDNRPDATQVKQWVHARLSKKSVPLFNHVLSPTV